MSDLPGQLRKAFEDTKSNHVRDWNVLLRAADEIGRLEKIERMYYDLQLQNELDLEAQGRVIAKVMQAGNSSEAVRVVIHNDACGRIPADQKALAGGRTWYVDKAHGGLLRRAMRYPKTELCKSCKPELADLMRRVREQGEVEQ